MNSFSIPVKSLDDLQKMTEFKLYIFGGGSTETLLTKWAQDGEAAQPAIWKQKAYKKFIKTGMEDPHQLRIVFHEMLNSDVSSNVALLQDRDTIGKSFKQSKYT